MRHPRKWPLLWAVLAASAASPALAREYPVEVRVRTEEDVFELYTQGDLTDEDLNLLVSLLQSPVDLNKATREDLYDVPGITYGVADAIIEHRSKIAKFKKVSDLKLVKGVTPAIYSQARPFVIVIAPRDKARPVRGKLRLRGIDDVSDEEYPEQYASLQGNALGWVGFGGVALLREKLDGVGYVEPGGLPAVKASGYSYGLEFPKFYAFVDRPAWGVVAGSYQAGFGQRLTFNESARSNPSGWYEDVQMYEDYDNAKFKQSKRLFGVAAQYNRLPLGGGKWLSGAVLYSNEAQDLYYTYMGPDVDCDGLDLGWTSKQKADLCERSTKVYDSPAPEEPCKDGDTKCKDAHPTFKYPTVPDMYREQLGAGNVALHLDNRTHVGVTGYAAESHFEYGSGDDFEFRNDIPNDDVYGAVGGDAAWGYGIANAFAEYARTLAGGNAAVGRVVFEPHRFQIELSGRHFGEDFLNPHGTGYGAAPDMNQYSRASDEQGGKLKVVYNPISRLRLRAWYDLWRHPSIDWWDHEIFGGADLQVVRGLVVGTWAKLNDNNIHEGGSEESYSDVDAMYEEGADSYSGKGQRVQVAGHVTSKLVPRTSLNLLYKASWEDVGKEDREMSHYGWFKFIVRTWPGASVSGRFKHYDEDAEDVERGERYLEVYGEVRQRFVSWLVARLRYTYVRPTREYSEKDAWRYSQLEDQHQLRWVIDARF